MNICCFDLHSKLFKVKLAENMINNTPYGFSFGRGKNNNKLMKLISPNMMKIGRINSRTLNGPVKLPEGPASMMNKVEEAFKTFYKIYNDTMVAKLLQDTQPKWFRSEKDLKVGDVVYFRKDEGSAIKGAWTTGVVEEIVKSGDGLVREATVKYCNSTEDTPRFTDRSVRTLVRLFNVEDGHWREDMEQVEKILKAKNIEVELEKTEESGTEALYGRKKSSIGDSDPSLCRCCCEVHCSLSLHVSRGAHLVKQSMFEKPQVDMYMEVRQDGWDYCLDKLEDYLEDEAALTSLGDGFEQDTFMGLITSVNVDFSS